MNTIWRKKILVIVAHNDDELIFFGSLIYHLSPICDISVVSLSNERRGTFFKTCKKLGAVDSRSLNVSYSGRDKKKFTDELCEEIASLIKPILLEKKPDIIVTHGEDGEYGNGFHSRVSGAVDYLYRQLGGYGLEIWRREPSGTIVFTAEYSLKVNLLRGYNLPSPGSWTKYMKAEERYLVS